MARVELWSLVWGVPRLIVWTLLSSILRFKAKTSSTLNQSFSITLQVSSLVTAAIILCFCGWAYFRYRLQTNYSRLPNDDPDDRGPLEAWREEDNDSDDLGGEKPTYTSYFDEFLNAIQVFGYLDRQVFHELTRHMRTHRLDAGETIKIKDLDGFALVIDGAVDVYSRNSDADSEESRWRKLTEVGRASPLSSIFSVLALFTESFELCPRLAGRNQPGLTGSNFQDFHYSSGCKLGNEEFDKEELKDGEKCKFHEFHEFHDEVIAVGQVETSIAVIPSESFRQLTRKYPLHTSNIIQIMLLRWSRVTLRSLGSFIDLLKPMFAMEDALNDSMQKPITQVLREAVLRRLQRIKKDGPELNIHSLPRHHQAYHHTATGVYNFSGLQGFDLNHQYDETYPGDLLSNVPLTRTKPSYLDAMQDLGQASAIGSAATSVGPSRTMSVADSLGRSMRQGSLVNNLDAAIDRKNSFIVGSSMPNDDCETDDVGCRRLLVEHLFELLGVQSFDHSFTEPSSKRAPNTPSARTGVQRFAETSLGFSLGLAKEVSYNLGTTQEEAITSELSYKDLIHHASNLVDIKLYKKDEVLSRESGKSRGLFLVIDGALSISYTRLDIVRHLRDVHAGQVTGFIETVASYSSFVTITAKSDVCVAFLSKSDIEKLADRFPPLFISIAKTMTHLLPRSLAHLDMALEWESIKSGEVLFRQSDPANAIYYILNGRIRHVKDAAKVKLEDETEFGHGSSLGQLEVLLGKPYEHTALAVRETELAKLPKALIEALPQLFPSTTFELARVVASGVLRQQNQLARAQHSVPVHGFGTNIRTISIVPTSEGLPLEEFAVKLASAFKANGREAHLLFHAQILQFLGRYAFSRMGMLKLKTHLADLEQQYKTLILVAESGVKSYWTRTCIDKADCVLLLADAAGEPVYSEYERLLIRSKSSARAHLVLLHQSSYVYPGSTQKWLKNRPWVTRHHHVQLQFWPAASPSPKPRKERAGLKKLKQIKDRVQAELFTRYKMAHASSVSPDHNKYSHKNDFSRLARILSGDAIGLVLGGGGARGISHVGVIKAIEEAGIPVDLIGGTSIGSFVGGLYAREHDLVPIYGRAKQFSSRMSAMWRMLLDLTYPTISYTTGHAFNRGIWKAFGDARIEDFWVNYFCNTTNLTYSRMDVHTGGYAWRYIRASMSLAGLVPPIEDKGQMLLDGGYMDNLPVTEMLTLGARHVIAVDVGSVDDTTEMDYGDTLSGLWVLFNRFNPFSSHPRVPNLAEIQARLAYVSSVKALEIAKVTPGIVYLRPPIEGYATLDFGKFDEIVAVGYAYTARKIRELGLSEILGAECNGTETRRPLYFRRHSI